LLAWAKPKVTITELENHAVIFSYFDESGDDKRKTHVAIGGIIGHEILLNLVEQDWIQTTKHLREPFRSTDCECQHGQFAHWDKTRCDELMRRLVITLAHERAGCYAFDVPVQLYREVFPISAEQDPMRLAIAHTVVEMARLARKHREKVSLWFEKGPFRSLTDKTFCDLQELKSWRLSERGTLFKLSFGDKTLVPLQAADLIAREGFKLAANYGVRNLRKPVLGMWNRMGMGFYTKETLELLKQRGWPANLESVTSLPDTCYLKESRNDGTQYFRTDPPESRSGSVTILDISKTNREAPRSLWTSEVDSH
jgi:hypothetical protein